MNLSELKDVVGSEAFEISSAFYRDLFSILSTNRIMYELGLCPKLIVEMDDHDYDGFVKIVSETAQTLGH